MSEGGTSLPGSSAGCEELSNNSPSETSLLVAAGVTKRTAGRAAIACSVEAASAVEVVDCGLGVDRHGSVANTLLTDTRSFLRLAIGVVATSRNGEDGPRNMYARRGLERHAVGIGIRVAGCL
jgi:hypothetical protein